MSHLSSPGPGRGSARRSAGRDFSLCPGMPFVKNRLKTGRFVRALYRTAGTQTRCARPIREPRSQGGQTAPNLRAAAIYTHPPPISPRGNFLSTAWKAGTTFSIAWKLYFHPVETLFPRRGKGAYPFPPRGNFLSTAWKAGTPFSIAWKLYFHGVETLFPRYGKVASLFPSRGNVLSIAWERGTYFSTAWKNYFLYVEIGG